MDNWRNDVKEESGKQPLKTCHSDRLYKTSHMDWSGN